MNEGIENRQVLVLRICTLFASGVALSLSLSPLSSSLSQTLTLIHYHTLSVCKAEVGGECYVPVTVLSYGLQLEKGGYYIRHCEKEKKEKKLVPLFPPLLGFAAVFASLFPFLSFSL